MNFCTTWMCPHSSRTHDHGTCSHPKKAESDLRSPSAGRRAATGKPCPPAPQYWRTESARFWCFSICATSIPFFDTRAEPPRTSSKRHLPRSAGETFVFPKLFGSHARLYLPNVAFQALLSPFTCCFMACRSLRCHVGWLLTLLVATCLKPSLGRNCLCIAWTVGLNETKVSLLPCFPVSPRRPKFPNSSAWTPCLASSLTTATSITANGKIFWSGWGNVSIFIAGLQPWSNPCIQHRSKDSMSTSLLNSAAKWTGIAYVWYPSTTSRPTAESLKPVVRGCGKRWTRATFTPGLGRTPPPRIF